MTVAQAIEYKNSIVFEDTLMQIMSKELVDAINNVDNRNELVENMADAHVIGIFGDGKEIKNKPQDDMNKAREMYVKAHEWLLDDPLNADKIINDLRVNIDTFRSNVDDIINTSNVQTHIQIEY